MASEFDLESSNEIIFALEDFDKYEENVFRVLKVCSGGNSIWKKNLEGRRCRFSVMKKSCVWQT